MKDQKAVTTKHSTIATKITGGCTYGTVMLERTYDDVTRQGEIKGLTFDKETGNLLLLYNRAARIDSGIPIGLLVESQYHYGCGAC